MDKLPRFGIKATDNAVMIAQPEVALLITSQCHDSGASNVVREIDKEVRTAGMAIDLDLRTRGIETIQTKKRNGEPKILFGILINGRYRRWWPR